MDETTQHIGAFVLVEFSEYVARCVSELSGDTIDLSAKLLNAIVERLASGPELQFGDGMFNVVVPAELLEAGFGREQITLEVSDWFIEDYYDMLEQSFSGHEDGGLSPIGVDPDAAASEVLPASVLAPSRVTSAAHPPTAPFAVHEPDEWVLKCCCVVLMSGTLEELSEKAERLCADEWFPTPLTHHLAVVRSQPRDPRVDQDLAEGCGSHVEASSTGDEGLSFQQILNDTLKRLGL